MNGGCPTCAEDINKCVCGPYSNIAKIEMEPCSTCKEAKEYCMCTCDDQERKAYMALNARQADTIKELQEKVETTQAISDRGWEEVAKLKEANAQASHRAEKASAELDIWKKTAATMLVTHEERVASVKKILEETTEQLRTARAELQELHGTTDTLALGLYGMLEESKAENYLEVHLVAKRDGGDKPFIVTISKSAMQTPHQLRKQAEERGAEVWDIAWKAESERFLLEEQVTQLKKELAEVRSARELDNENLLNDEQIAMVARIGELEEQLAQRDAEPAIWRAESNGWKESEGTCSRLYDELHDENEKLKAELERQHSNLKMQARIMMKAVGEVADLIDLKNNWRNLVEALVTHYACLPKTAYLRMDGKFIKEGAQPPEFTECSAYLKAALEEWK